MKEVWHCKPKDTSADVYECILQKADKQGTKGNPDSSAPLSPQESEGVHTMNFTYKARGSLQRIDVTTPDHPESVVSLFGVPDKCLAVLARVSPDESAEDSDIQSQQCHIGSQSFTIGTQAFQFDQPFATGAQKP